MSDSRHRKYGSSILNDDDDEPLLSTSQERRREEHVKKKRSKSPNRSTSDHHHHRHHHHRHHHHHHHPHRHRRHHSPNERSKSSEKEVSALDLDRLRRHHHHSRSKSSDKEVSFHNARLDITSPLNDNNKASSDGKKKSKIRISANTTQHQTHQNQARDLDEAYRLYFYAERAALKIQQAFRERQKQKELLLNKDYDSDAATEKQSVDVEVGGMDSGEEEDASNNYTMIFLALFTIVMVVPKLLMTCYGVIIKCCGGGDDTGGVDAIANTAMPQGGAGGAAGPTPTGGEAGAAGGAQAGAQGAMAAQAASSAASGAASGVASGAAAGAAATSATAAATAGATAAAAGATQVATVVAVSTAAVAATSAAVIANTPPPAAEPILSICGIANPDIRSGRMVMLFEGLPRPFDDRESGLVENLVMESYNELTLGTNVEETGCLDPLAREMQSVAIVNQTLFFGTGELDPNKLEVVFEAQVSCDRCSDTSPLFSEEQLEGSNGNSADTVGNTTDVADFDIVANATTEGVVMEQNDEQSRLLLSVDFTSQKFFQKLIQLVIIETEELADEGELPEGFVQISKALVVTSDEKEEETLVTEIKYKRQAASNSGESGSGSGSGGNNGGGRDNVMATFEFEFVDESGEVQKETIEVTEEGEAVPTTAFPTFQPTRTPTHSPSLVPTASPTIQPSHRPTDTPSSLPTKVFSGQPTFLPSAEPSGAPSNLPSQSPSDAPSVEPSEPPSDVPSVIPSEAPSQIPSVVPSDAPSSSPSMVPSEVPSFVPSEVPSEVPSFVPSEIPSDAPSASPSNDPSAMPSPEPSSQPTGAQLLTLPGMSASQSSNHLGSASAGGAFKAIDGNTNGNYAAGGGSVSHTEIQNDPWWQVNMGATYGGPCIVKWVTIWNRSDCCWDRLYGGWIQLLDSNGVVTQQQQITSGIGAGAQTLYFIPTPNVYWVRVRLWGAGRFLQIAELQAWGYVA